MTLTFTLGRWVGTGTRKQLRQMVGYRMRRSRPGGRLWKALGDLMS